MKDLNRQYELNNNCDLDNGVYNKFVNQSSSSSSSESDEVKSILQDQVRMFDDIDNK